MLTIFHNGALRPRHARETSREDARAQRSSGPVCSRSTTKRAADRLDLRPEAAARAPVAVALGGGPEVTRCCARNGRKPARRRLATRKLVEEGKAPRGEGSPATARTFRYGGNLPHFVDAMREMWRGKVGYDHFSWRLPRDTATMAGAGVSRMTEQRTCRAARLARVDKPRTFARRAVRGQAHGPATARSNRPRRHARSASEGVRCRAWQHRFCRAPSTSKTYAHDRVRRN